MIHFAPWKTSNAEFKADYQSQLKNWVNKIMANYIPSNQRSANLLEKLGFVVEGKARKYLLINGVWEDHILASLTNDDWKN